MSASLERERLPGGLAIEMLPELDAAVAFLQDELAQLRAGALDHRLCTLVEAPPLPSDRFSTLLSVWKAPPPPPALVELARALAPKDTGEQAMVDVVASESDDSGGGDTSDAKTAGVDIVVNEDAAVRVAPEKAKPQDEAATNADTERVLASLRALRKSMLLDVLSKIRSVAKSKGVDPALFATRNARESDKAAFLGLDAISREVERGATADWELFAHQVYVFCQHVIADSERRAQPEAKQKGVELLHFARTLTETLRQASAKKEEALLEEIASSQRAVAATMSVTLLATVTPTLGAADVATAPTVDAGDVDEAAGQEVENDETAAAAAEDKRAESPPPSLASASASPLSRRLSADAALTPNRVSARIRRRGSSFSFGDGASAHDQPPRDNSDDDGDEHDAGDGDDDAEVRTKKRPRAASSVSTSTPPPAAAVVHTTASEDDNMSGESESQLSASEAESHKRRGGRAREPASSAQTTPTTRTRTRQRRPVLPATRVSSRQQKRRAERARAAEDDDDEKEASDATTTTHRHDGEDDTAQDDDDDDAHTNQSDAGATPPPPPPPNVPLTKAGRPRKRPGRKPAGWKKGDSK
ncbi:hypothetical protein PybrP1_011128 [[Pythium] brassicae (nom. inval.)]|nr:hypothetical protein PybrP1_011128 [[Pythium] brassicae (nom. inval.)]